MGFIVWTAYYASTIFVEKSLKLKIKLPAFRKHFLGGIKGDRQNLWQFKDN